MDLLQAHLDGCHHEIDCARTLPANFRRFARLSETYSNRGGRCCRAYTLRLFFFTVRLLLFGAFKDVGDPEDTSARYPHSLTQVKALNAPKKAKILQLVHAATRRARLALYLHGDQHERRWQTWIAKVGD